MQDLSNDGKIRYTSPVVVEKKVQEMAAENGVRVTGRTLVGFTPDDAYERANMALWNGNSHAWQQSTEYRM